MPRQPASCFSCHLRVWAEQSSISPMEITLHKCIPSFKHLRRSWSGWGKGEGISAHFLKNSRVPVTMGRGLGGEMGSAGEGFAKRKAGKWYRQPWHSTRATGGVGGDRLPLKPPQPGTIWPQCVTGSTSPSLWHTGHRVGWMAGSSVPSALCSSPDSTYPCPETWSFGTALDSPFSGGPIPLILEDSKETHSCLFRQNLVQT